MTYLNEMRYEMKKIIILMSILCIFLSSCATAQKRRQDYVKAHPELDDQIKESILNGKIILGMTKAQVIASWGRPVRIRQPVGSWRVYEQWIYYNDPDSPHSCPIIYVYFRNGIVESWGECG